MAAVVGTAALLLLQPALLMSPLPRVTEVVIHLEVLTTRLVEMTLAELHMVEDVSIVERMGNSFRITFNSLVLI